jgi:lia operon protein LiaG
MSSKAHDLRRLFAAAALLAAGPLAGQQTERFELSGDAIAIYNLAGTVTVTGGSGAAVIVELTRGGADQARLRVETGPLDGRETLRVLYPTDRLVYRTGRGHHQTRVYVNPDGTFGDGDSWRRRGDRVEIRSSGSGLEAYADLRITVPAGRRFTLHLAAGDVSAADLEGTVTIDTHSAPVTASRIRGSLFVDVGSGSVEVTDVQGDVSLDTGSGSMRVSGVSGATVVLDTGSGSVVASDVTATNLVIDTGSGGIDLARASAETITLDTGSGTITAELLADPRNVVIDSGSGSVRLTVPPDFGAEVEIDTGSGGIDVDLPLQLRRWERNHVVGSIGDGQGRLVIDTGSGSVTIRRGS